MRKFVLFTVVVMLVWLLGGNTGWAQKYQGKEGTELAKGLKGAGVSLEKGLLTSEREGKPISGKFEMEDGKLHLSLYTEKGGKFSEVLVDPKSGKVVKVEAIASGEDLTAAKAQGEAMAKAKLSLRGAIEKALKTHKGFRAVSIFPALKDGHPVADVTLIKGEEFKTASEKLD
jgi:uncharacterized membrane protein YkoI